jgi:hypothetical protein
MDPVMQALFGKMPIEQLSAVKAATTNNNNTNTILFIGGVALVLGVTAYLLYQKNLELNKQLIKVKIKQP